MTGSMSASDVYVHLFTEDGRHLHGDGLIVRDLSAVPQLEDNLVAFTTRDENDPTKQTIYEVLRRYIIDEWHVHLLVRGRPGTYEEYHVRGI
jgi:hypothetical protein